MDSLLCYTFAPFSPQNDERQFHKTSIDREELLRHKEVVQNVSVQKCHNAPICGLFAKPANLIFKFLSLKISLIQADCHWKQVLVVRSTRFHGFEQSLEILPERDSDLLASLDKGIVHC